MKTYAIGDIHGMLEPLLAAIGYIDAQSAHEPTRVVFCGDYVDRGPDSAGVIRRLLKGPNVAHHEWVCLRGNHDDMMSTEEDGWIGHYGMHTLESYGGLDEAIRDGSEFQLHQKWIRSLPTAFEDEHRIFVHAGLLPGQALKDCSDNVRLWVREQFLNSDFDWGKLVVHGHTPTQLDMGGCKPIMVNHRLNIDTGACWPGQGGKLTVVSFDGPDWAYEQPNCYEQF